MKLKPKTDNQITMSRYFMDTNLYAHLDGRSFSCLFLSPYFIRFIYLHANVIIIQVTKNTNFISFFLLFFVTLKYYVYNNSNNKRLYIHMYAILWIHLEITNESTNYNTLVCSKFVFVSIGITKLLLRLLFVNATVCLFV